MILTPDMIKLVQSELNKRYNAGLVVDGDAGMKTSAALMKVEVLPTEWSQDRKIIGFIQHVATLEGINAGSIDGRWGPQTDQAHEDLVYKLTNGKLPEPWRQDEFHGEEAGQWPLQNEASMNAFYGEVGTNQGKCNSPYPLKLAWDLSKTVNRFTCHEKVAPVIERILKKVLDHYGLEEIQRLRLDLWGGALNVRKMRGGTKWSTHSWGTSVDWDPSNNKLKWGKDKATLAHPDYDFWWKCWEEEGAVSLGREQDRDWMHVQFARLK
jgi:hypothetical protein